MDIDKTAWVLSESCRRCAELARYHVAVDGWRFEHTVSARSRDSGRSRVKQSHRQKVPHFRM